MKTLELELKKRLLIVEIPEGKSSEEVLSEYKGVSGDQWDFLCKGSDLTEDIAKGLVDLHETGYYKDYLNDNNFFTLPSKSFISAIESKGYHWGENTVKFIENEMNWEKRHKNRIEWEQAESRTLNPSKCIIFEIV